MALDTEDVDTSEPQATENKNIQVEKESLTNLDDNSQLDESLLTEDNGDNPLGIIIEPSQTNQEPFNTIPLGHNVQIKGPRIQAKKV